MLSNFIQFENVRMPSAKQIKSSKNIIDLMAVCSLIYVAQSRFPFVVRSDGLKLVLFRIMSPTRNG